MSEFTCCVLTAFYPFIDHIEELQTSYSYVLEAKWFYKWHPILSTKLNGIHWLNGSSAIITFKWWIYRCLLSFMNYKQVYSLCMSLLVHSYWVWTDLKPRLRGLFHWWLPDEFTNANRWPCLMHLFTYLMNWRREAGWWFRGMELSTYWFRRVPSPMEIDHFDVVLWQVRSYFVFFGFFCLWLFLFIAQK